MLTSPALLSMVSSRSASTRAISTRSAGALSRPGNTGALVSSRLATESSLAAIGAGSCGVIAYAPATAGGAPDTARSGGATVTGRAAIGTAARVGAAASADAGASVGTAATAGAAA